MFLKPSEQRHPFNSLILLGLIAVAGFIVFGVIAYIAGYLIFGPAQVEALQSGTAGAGIQKLFIAFSSIGMFVMPPLIFARLESREPLQYLKFRKPKSAYLIFLSLILMVSATPFIEWTVFLNQQMQLPEFLEPLETWMKYKEMAAEILTKQLLVMDSVQSLLLNLVIIAIIPALGEELLFRGCIQKLLIRWTNNYHIGIWLAAILFSAIHLQFYGFIPRMLLGALFGYMLVLSNSIWVPIIAHFYNNASAVIMAYIFQRQGKSLDDLTKPDFESWYLVILSVIFTAILLTAFRKLSVNHNNLQNGR
ncbi:MAG: CPBP family intramembrane glutamic endopeptidase [Sphingobacteriaceae bacterium]